jgi:hypothetical protein
VTQGLWGDHLRLLMSTYMGGMDSWLRGEMHPKFMDTLLPFASLPSQISGRDRGWRRVIIDAIRADPAWENGDYRKRASSVCSLPRHSSVCPATPSSDRTRRRRARSRIKPSTSPWRGGSATRLLLLGRLGLAASGVEIADAVTEQGRTLRARGGDGDKAVHQREPDLGSRVPDSAADRQVDLVLLCAGCNLTASPLSPEVGAGCGCSPRPDLRGALTTRVVSAATA